MTTIRRRPMRTASYLAGAVAALMLATAGSAEAATNNAGMATIPLIIKNKSGLKKPVSVFITGQSNDGGAYYYVTNAAGDVRTFPHAPSGKSLPYVAYGQSLGKKKTIKLMVPYLWNTRIYVSYGSRMYFNSNQSGVPSTPAGWDSTDRNYKILYDWAEFSWEPVGQPSPFQTVLNGNLTQVDMLGLPMLLQFGGLSATQKKTVTMAGFSAKTARSSIFSAFAKAGLPWSRLVVNPRSRVPLRVNSPYNGMKNGTFPTNQLAGYINQVFATYAKKPIYADTNADGTDASFKGQVTGANMVFTEVGNSANTVTFAKPTSDQAYSGYAGTVPAGASQLLQDQAAQMGTFVQAAYMRGTMITEPVISDCPGTAAYYKNKPVNMYASIMHQYAFGHRAYGFGYDDVCNQSSDETVFNPTGITLTVQPVQAKRHARHRRR